jgi:hypothetical protein
VPSWKNPSGADALPAFRLNGAMARADAFGFVTPTQERKQ